MNNNLNESVSKLQKENLIINEKYLELKTKVEELKISNDGFNQDILFYDPLDCSSGNHDHLYQQPAVIP